MEIKLQTLTPIWTGGIDAGKCDRIHETSILGSLRWWMEVLVRGMGGDACDPTLQKCLYDSTKVNNGLCNVCQIFGTTGWKRKFRLEVIQDNTQPDVNVSSKLQAERSNNKTSKPPTWYFPRELEDKPRSGTFTIQIQGLDTKFRPEIIGSLIQFIADCAALGARPQMGFGVVQIDGKRIDTKPLYDWLINIVGNHTYQELPSLTNVFLVQIQPKSLKTSFQEKDTFNLKYDLRQLFRIENTPQQSKSENKGLVLKMNQNTNRDNNDKDLRHFLMGTVANDRMAAKVKISRSYGNDKLMRVWGWVPDKAEVYKNGWSRGEVIDTICQHLKANYNLHSWREMNSERDTVTTNQPDVQAFLRSLLQLQEGN
jgi:CRISPR-associated protein Cmr1